MSEPIRRLNIKNLTDSSEPTLLEYQKLGMVFQAVDGLNPGTMEFSDAFYDAIRDNFGTDFPMYRIEEMLGAIGRWAPRETFRPMPLAPPDPE